MDRQETLLEFPCQFPVKIIGMTREGVADEMVRLVLRHAPDFDVTQVEMRTSSEGKYLSLTCLINATSKAQLDDLYRELSAHAWVKVAL